MRTITRGWLAPVLALYWRRRRRPMRAIAPGRLAAVTNVFAPLTRVSVHNHLHATTRPGAAVAPSTTTVFRTIAERITVWRWLKARPLDAERTPTPIAAAMAATTHPPVRVSASTLEAASPVSVRARRVADGMPRERDRARIRSWIDREPVAWRSPMRSPRVALRDAAMPNLLHARVPPGRRVDRRGPDVVTPSVARQRSSSPAPAVSPRPAARGQQVIAFPHRTRASATARPSAPDLRADRRIASASPRAPRPRTVVTTAASARRVDSRGAGYAAAVSLDWRRPPTPPDRRSVEQPHGSVADRAAAPSSVPGVAIGQAPQPAASSPTAPPAALLPLDRAAIDRLAENVISRIERHIRIERERRGR